MPPTRSPSSVRSRSFLWLVALLGALGSLAAARAEAAPDVVASILPVHSLVAQVMEGVGEPILLVQGGQSEHDFALRPSDARAIQGADLVVWIGNGLETFLARPLEALGSDGRVLTLANALGVNLLPLRGGGDWAPDDHEDGHDHDHADHGFDMHLWLAPANGKAILRAVAGELAAIDPEHAGRYMENADKAAAALDDLDAELAERLAPVRARPYIVFHDAFRYFEDAYGLNPVGSILLSTPEIQAGVRRVRDIQAMVRDRGVVCVFHEPQYDPRPAELAVEGSEAHTGVLDPTGASLAPGPDAYAALLRELAVGLVSCLSRRS